MTVDNRAAAFAKAHGSFSLHFNADQNYARPDDVPWSLELHGREVEWGGYTAEEAIDFAAAELRKEVMPVEPVSDDH